MRMHPPRFRATRASAGALALLWAGGVAALAYGQPSAPRTENAAEPAAAAVRIAAPEALMSGTTASVAVFVRLPPGPAQPLLLTPSAEGEAVRVARGRLLRADARTTETGELQFLVPIEARSAGTAVLRVALLTYACEARCNTVRVTESITLQVRAL